MNKCDKCGCEHSSTSTCPKCGAPVVMVNQDYLLRRKEWEEKQKQYLKDGKPQLDEKTKEADKPEASSNTRFKSGTKPSPKVYLKAIIKAIKKRIAARKEANAKKNKILASRERKRNLAIAGITAIIILVAVIIVLNMDFSSIIYYDGHEVRSDKNLIFSSDKYGFLENNILDYSEDMKAFLIDTGSGYVVRYGDKDISLTDYEVLGSSHNGQYMFSKSGRYFTWVSLVENEYSLHILDLKNAKENSFTYEGMTHIYGIDESGLVCYSVMEIMEDAIVVDNSIYLSGVNQTCLIAESAKKAAYISPDLLVYIYNDDLYRVELDKVSKVFSAKEGTTLIAEEIEDIVVNKAGEDILYTTENGLYVFDGSSRLVSSNISATDEVYYAADKYLYYIDINNVYKDVQGRKTPVTVRKSESSTLLFDGKILFVDVDDKLWELAGDNKEKFTEGVTNVGKISGVKGYAYSTLKSQFTVISGKTREVCPNTTQKSFQVIIHGNDVYYIDGSSVLYKAVKDRKESLGFVYWAK